MEISSTVSQRILPLPQLREDDFYHTERQTVPLLNVSDGQQKSKGQTGLPITSTPEAHSGLSQNKSVPLPNDPFQIS